MNYVFSALILLSIITSFFTDNVSATANAALEGAKASVEIVLSFAGIMCMWSGFLKLADEGGASFVLCKIIRPFTKLLFPRLKKDSKALKNISTNISANLLGVGNAATPAGISAMEELDKINEIPLYASDEMSIFTVMNTASIQLIPTTVIAIRASLSSINPASIIIPVWISSVCSLISAVMLMKLILFVRKKRRM